MGKKKKGSKKKKKAGGKKAGASKEGKNGKKKGKKKGKKSTSRPNSTDTGESAIQAEPEPRRVLVKEFSGNNYFRTFQIQSPAAMLNIAKAHGSLKSQRLLGALKRAEEHEKAKAEAAALIVAQKQAQMIAMGMDPAMALAMAALPNAVDGGTTGDLRPITTGSTKSEKSAKKGKGGSSKPGTKPGTPASSKGGSRPGTSQSGKKGKKGKKKGKKGKKKGGKTGGGEIAEALGESGDPDFQPFASGIMIEGDDRPSADWSVFQEELVASRQREHFAERAAKGLWVPETTDEDEHVDQLPSLGSEAHAKAYDDLLDENEEDEERADPVLEACWKLVGGEKRYSQKLRLRAEIKEIYQGTSGFRSLSVNKNAAERYRWKFEPDKESGIAWMRGKPPEVFPEV